MPIFRPPMTPTLPGPIAPGRMVGPAIRPPAGDMQPRANPPSVQRPVMTGPEVGEMPMAGMGSFTL